MWGTCLLLSRSPFLLVRSLVLITEGESCLGLPPLQKFRRAPMIMMTNSKRVQKSTAYRSKRVQPTRGWTVAASTQHKLYSLLLPPAMGARFYRFLGRPAKWTRWLAGAAAIKSG